MESQALWFTFERKVGEESHIFGTLPMLGQSSKDQKPSPTSAIGARADTLYPDSKGVEITCSNYARFDCADRFKPPVNEEDEGEKDAPSKNPFRDLERYYRFDLPAPTVEEQEVRSSKSINPVYSD